MRQAKSMTERVLPDGTVEFVLRIGNTRIKTVVPKAQADCIREGLTMGMSKQSIRRR